MSSHKQTCPTLHALLSVALLLGANILPVSAQTAPALVQVSASKDGATFGLLADKRIVVLQNGEWKLISGLLTQISVGAWNNVWGVNHEQKLFRLTPTGWVALPGLYKAVSAASDGSVAALDLAGNVLQWIPEKQAMVSVPTQAGGFSKIAAGKRDRLYGLTAQGTVYKYQPAFSAWKSVNGKFKDVFVTSDGIVTVKDYQDVAFSRTDFAVDLETLHGLIVKDTNWIADPMINNSGLQLATPVTASTVTGIRNISANQITTVTLENAFITVTPDPVAADKPVLNVDTTAPSNTAVISTTGCVTLSGNLATPKLDMTNGAPKTITVVKPSTGCLTGKTFTRVINGNTTNNTTSFGVYWDLGIAKAAAENAQQNFTWTGNLDGPVGTLSCAPDSSTFGTYSDRSWVQFTLPAATAGKTITVPQGAHNNYVFPRCNRVWWDQMTFKCINGKWVAKGSYGADGLCHGWAGPSDYYRIGNR